MKKISVIFVVLLCLAGCSTTTALYQVRAQNKAKITRLTPGMTKDKVLNMMGTKEIIVCNSWGDTIGVVKNPFKTELLKTNNKTYEILYYYTDIIHSDADISEDELTPIVFENNKLIGFGWQVLSWAEEKEK
ncbi:MAG: DUF3192 domain-containing protein [Candidatus Omnitrophica bacterium]|nr:DUF3192 domain-containing protein [Candidatus Omnitrophota bacterium]